MEMFSLPHTAKVNRVIPKNAFDAYTNSKQKKLFTDQILRITWLQKLSPGTVNLEAKEIQEIQIFKIELKVREDMQTLLEIIDRAIPYNIIFIIEESDSIYLSTSTKHPHPVNADNSVIDWTFKTSWFLPRLNKYSLHLKKNLDAVYHDFCIQLTGDKKMARKSLQDLVQYNKQVDALEKEITQLKKSIKNSKQYKYKVELNLLLKQRTLELKNLIS
ncbi:MAG: DUF4391 domain-containing protein [Chitinophagaceae bacterium]|nr:DUF4391 domain-containing protein [Chitinophagaceae bacterium]